MTIELISDLTVLGLCFLSAAGSALVTLAAYRDAARGTKEENARLKRRVERYRHGAEWLLSRATPMSERRLNELKRRPQFHNDAPGAAGGT